MSIRGGSIISAEPMTLGEAEDPNFRLVSSQLHKGVFCPGRRGLIEDLVLPPEFFGSLIQSTPTATLRN